MLKKSSSGVLASLRDSTYRTDPLGCRNDWWGFPFAKTHSRGERPTRCTVRTSSALRLPRPRWTALLSILSVFSHCCRYADHRISTLPQYFYCSQLVQCPSG